MNKLTNEEIARVFAMYLYCNFRYRYIDYEPGVWATGAKLLPERLVRVLNDKSVDGVELLLTPLSKITDEHAIKLSELINDEKFNEGETFKVISEENRIVVYSSKVLHDSVDMGYRYTTTIYSDMYAIKSKPHSTIQQMPYEAYQFLVQQGYNVPLFFGFNHWANGKTAVELGIAIESN